MSRIRYIKPGFFCDEDLADCSPWARLLFAGLWGIADKAGRLEDRPRRIAATVFPYDRDVDVEECLRELCDHGPMILRYEADGARYIAILGWAKHQKTHHKEAESVIPEPNPSVSNPPPAPHQPLTSPSPAALVTGNGERVMGNGEEPLSNSDESDGFDEFWTAYPRRENKQKSVSAWKRLPKRERPLAVSIAKRMSELFADGVKEKQFIPLPSTYLNQKRWEDWECGPPADWQSGARESCATLSLVVGQCPKCGSELRKNAEGVTCCPRCGPGEWVSQLNGPSLWRPDD